LKRSFAVCLLVLLVSLSACSDVESDLVQVATKGKSSGIIGSINDYSESLPDMLEYADLIIIGRVVKQDNFGDLSVLTEVKVSRTVKGKNYDIVNVLQLKDGYELTIGEEYLLALASQPPDYEEDFYAVCASFQGAFRQVGTRIETYDEAFVPEIQKFVTKNNKNSLSLNELADWFATIIKK